MMENTKPSRALIRRYKSLIVKHNITHKQQAKKLALLILGLAKLNAWIEGYAGASSKKEREKYTSLLSHAIWLLSFDIPYSVKGEAGSLAYWFCAEDILTDLSITEPN